MPRRPRAPGAAAGAALAMLFALAAVTLAFPLTAQAQANATGEPAITGTATVGETLTVTQGTIADPQGFPVNWFSNATTTVQWIRVDSGTDSDISSATGRTYTLVDDDLGKQIKVKVDFADSQRTAESRTSAAFPSGGTVGAPDTTAPRLNSIAAQDPLSVLDSVPTNADTLTWRVTFSEAVSNVDAMDFLLSGPTNAMLAEQAVAGMTGAYDVTASGGDLASLTDFVYLFVSTSNDIEDLAGNALANTDPDGTAAFYKVDNTAPTLEITDVPLTSSAPFTGTFDFSEAVMGFEVGDITLGNAVAASFMSASSSLYTAQITPTADGTVTVDVLANSAQDLAGNGNTAAIRASSTYTAANTAPTGAPTITGTPTVGETLTAVTTAIMDGDGLTTPGYTYQWIRVATDTTETNIATATASTYTLVTDDLGTTIKVKVSFTDDASNAEMLTSAATAAVAAAPDTTPPTVTGTPTAGATGTQIQLAFSEALDQSNLPPDTAFTVTADGSAVTVTGIVTDPSFRLFVGVSISPLIRQGQSVVVTYTDPSGGNDTNALQDTAGNDVATFTTGMNSVSAVTNQSNVAATAPGAPTGLTATANGTTQIDLSWTAPADNGGRVITGYKIEISPNGTDTWTTHLADTTSTNTTYAHTGLAASTTRHYRVSAINTIGTSAASNVDSATTGAGSNTPPTASNGTVTATEDTDYTFTAPNFNFSDTDAGAALSSVKVTSLPASGKGTLKVDGTVIASGDLPKAVTKVDIDASKLTYSPPANANGDGYATFQFKVNDGTDDSASASTMTIDVTAVNDDPTGELAIMGQPVFGATLTLDHSAIMDVDGLPGLSDFDIQWLHVGNSTTQASGTATYTLSGKDVGKALTVVMGYEDDDGGKEEVALPRWPASGTISAIAPGAPTGLTATANGTTQIDLSWTAPASDGGSDITGYKIEISPNGTDTWTTHLADTTSTNTTYAHTGLAASTTRHYRVSAINTIGTSTASNVDDATTGAGTNTLPTASNGEVTATEDTDYTFTAPNFNFSDTDAGAALSSVKITSLPASGKGTLKVDGTVIGSGDLPKSVTKVDIDASKLTYTPPANANGNDYATFQFKVNDGTDDSATASTMTIDVTAVNDAPTVATAIPNQTAPVGTALNYAFPPNTFNDADSNTLTYTAMKADNAALPTWLSFTANTRTFSGTPQVTDVGTVAVKVTASDGNGGSVSDEFDITVSAASNSPATGAPTITGTPRVGQTLTAVTSAIMDANGLNNVSYTYQWIRVDGGTETNILMATASTYTLVTADQGKTIKVTVRFTDDANNPETLTSAATAAVSAAVNTRPPRVSITADLSVGEDIGTAVVPVTLSWPTQVSLSVPWSTSELNAVSPDDFTDGQGALTFAPGASRADISIRIADDGVQEGVEFFAVTLGTGEGYSLEHASAVVSILDNDDDELLPSRATVNGTKLDVTYDEALGSASAPIPSHFYVTADGMRIDVDEVSVGGSTVTLTLATAVQAGQTVTVGYVSGGDPIQDMEGNAAVSFSAWLVTNAAGGGGGGGTDPGNGGGTDPGTGGGTDPGTGGGTDPGTGGTGGGGGGGGGGSPATAPGAPESLMATAGDAEVVLEWTAPASSGGLAVRRYEVRHAAGDSVPADTPWQSAGLDLERTIADLTNGQPYAFEVRAVNIVGAGAAATARATPLALPLAPESLTATAANAQVVLAWSAPADDAAAPVDGYEYRYAASDTVPQDTPWQDAGTALTVTVGELENDRGYAFEVRAVNGAGPGPAASITATPLGVPLAPESLTATAGDAEVILAWSAPAVDAAAPVDGYEYRYAAGDTVPQDTPWQDAGTALTVTVGELENNRGYAFEVRAVNGAGPGPAASITATPLGVPLAPESLTATAGDAEVILAWSAPAHEGGSPVIGYEYRYAAGETVPEDTAWQDAGATLTVTVEELENEIRYVFEMRAVNRAGPGPAASTSAMPIRLRAELIAGAATATEGEALTVGVRRSGGLRYAAHAYIGVTDSAVPGVSAMDTGRDDGLGRQRLEFAAGEAESSIAISPAFDGQHAAGRTLTVTLEAAEVEIDGKRLSYEPEAGTLNVSVMDGDASVSVADARAEPGETALRFVVSLDRTRDVPIMVDYATADGTAVAGQDYTGVSGTLTLEPGRREAEVEVPVLGAPHLGGERMLRLTLSNSRNALIGDGEASGTIARASDLPQAWLTRFGRTASDQSAQAIRRRLESGGQESHLTVAGLRFDTFVSGFMGGEGQGAGSGYLDTPAVTAARAVPGQAHALTGGSFGAGGPGGQMGLAGATPGLHPGGFAGSSGYPGAIDNTGSRGTGLPTLRDALVGTSFYYTSIAAQDGGGQGGSAGGAGAGSGGAGFPAGWTVWGDAASTRFDGAKGGLRLDGDVVTGTMGLDFQGDGGWLGGLAVSYSDGAGDYAERGSGGTLSSTLTSVQPYAQYRVGERTQIWGALGYGSGELELTPDSGEALGTDLDNRMVALGGRSVVRRGGATGAFELSLNTDLLWSSTTADASDWLAHTTGESSRVRLMLEGRGRRTLDSGGTLIPTLEAGLRYDGGDAETGAGLEVGAGLGYATGRLTVKFDVRGLVAHEDAEYEEWGLSGSLIYAPRDDGRGLSVTMASAWGATQSGVQSLWSRQDASGLARGGAAMDVGRRLETRVGYGMDGRRGRALWVPYIGADALADGANALRLGVALSSGPHLQAGFEFGQRDGVRGEAEHALNLEGSIRF